MAKAQFTLEYWQGLAEKTRELLLAEVLTLTSLIQVAAVLIAFSLAYFIAMPAGRRLVQFLTTSVRSYRLKQIGNTLKKFLLPLVALILQWIAIAVLDSLGYRQDIVRVVSSLLAAWIVIRLFAELVPDPFWSRIVAVIAWSVAALNILNLLTPTIAFLDSFGIQVGKTNLTAFVVIKAIVVGGLLIWLATALSALLQRRIQRVTNLTPSVRTLIIQILRIALLLLAVMIALNTVGIDLTALAVFSGALGVGIGFGLQKVVSNFVSGIILLLDRSIEPGDVIEIEGTYGHVASLGARYTSVVTRDGYEYLIPNEQFITEQVVNWSYSTTHVRRKVDVGISYGSDVERARELIIEACNETERVLQDPRPVCHLIAFGDNSVNLQARFWIDDPENGVVNVTSEVMLKIWHKFHANGVEFPFPQRDVHLMADRPIDIRVTETPSD